MIYETLGVIGTVLGILGFGYMLYMRWKLQPVFKFAMRITRQWSTMMNEQREAKAEGRLTHLTEAQKSARKKLSQNVKSAIPFNLAKGMSDNEVLGLITDQDLMKGLVFMAKTGREFLNTVVGKLGGTKKEKSELGIEKIEVPDI